ncbi:hypothetical protein [Pontivivens ytuae]|uniref:Uncharacterized protein n=1 Tax=Pontivivens ytuae TaxID=2789856 RepID=A0A7S9LUE2_9RHOB|nr:hypothetical protein [Pontivivens ytuae]QPH55434.1 hypothetical protein I0K15_06780 [Pontivivens ytuae]
MRSIAVATAVLALPLMAGAQTFIVCDPISPTVSFCPDEEVSYRFPPSAFPSQDDDWQTLPGVVTWYRIRGLGISTRSATSHTPTLRFDADQPGKVSAGLQAAVVSLGGGLVADIREMVSTPLETGPALRAEVTLSHPASGRTSDFIVTVIPAEVGSVALWTTGEGRAHPATVSQVHDTSVANLRGGRP